MLQRIFLGVFVLLLPWSGRAVEVPPFLDVPEGVWYAFYVNEAARLGVVSGYRTAQGELTGFYGPGDAVTVAEILKMSLEAAKVNELECQGTAKHLQAHDHWSYLYVVCAEGKNFRLFATIPDLNRPALRSEVLAILHDAFGEDVPEAIAPFQDSRGDEYEHDIAYAAARGAVSGDTDAEGKPIGTFRPNDGVNRAEAAKMIYEQLRAYEKGSEGFETGLLGSQPQTPTDSGDFKLIFDAVSTAGHEQYEQVFRETGLFEEVVNALNDSIALPFDVFVVLGECTAPNAFYDPETKQIVLCYELLDDIAIDMAKVVATVEELGVGMLHTFLFLFYHELGHALIDIHELPITGREEDAADQLSTIVLVEADPEGEGFVLDGAAWFLLREERTGLYDSAFADEHALDRQRYYNLLCWVYGKNPQTHAYIVEELALPTERAVRCANEYSKMLNSWENLLDQRGVMIK